MNLIVTKESANLPRADVLVSALLEEHGLFRFGRWQGSYDFRLRSDMRFGLTYSAPFGSVSDLRFRFCVDWGDYCAGMTAPENDPAYVAFCDKLEAALLERFPDLDITGR